MYLAYDLLGGEHGPLRTLTRAITYGSLFGTGYALALGPVFGLASGLAHGITLAWEFSRASRREPKSGFWVDAAMSAIRATGFALGLAWSLGALFGIAFGLLSMVGQVIAYQFGIRPTADYQPATRPRLTRLLAWSAVNRTAGYAVAGYVVSLLSNHRERALLVGLKTGLTIGVVTAIASAFMPMVEWYADHLPEKRMGVVGVGMILMGFSLQSVQYWIVLANVGVR